MNRAWDRARNDVDMIVSTFKQKVGRPPATMCDVGANVGNYTLWFLHRLPKSSVYAFEPVPDNYEVLVKNIELNNFQSRVTAFNVGILNVSRLTTQDMFFPPERDALNTGLYSTQQFCEQQEPSLTARFSSFSGCIDDIDLLQSGFDIAKIDVEGAECDVLTSSDSFILKSKCIYIEVNPSFVLVDAVKDMLSQQFECLSHVKNNELWQRRDV